MGAEGRRQAETRFGQAEVAAQLFAIYAEVTGPPASDAAAPTAEPLVETTSVLSE